MLQQMVTRLLNLVRILVAEVPSVNSVYETNASMQRAAGLVRYDYNLFSRVCVYMYIFRMEYQGNTHSVIDEW